MSDSEKHKQSERDVWLSGIFDGFASGVHKNARDHGFWADRTNVAEKVMLSVTELSEFVEAHRRGELYNEDKHCPEHSNGVIELADTIIRCMDLAKGLSMDIGAALVAKVAYNATREYKHGKEY